MELIQQVYAAVMSVAVVALAVLIVISIVCSILGPGISDRIIAVNMIGTMVIMITAILSVMLNENYLADICLIYAMISFLGVVLFCKVYTGVYLQRKHMLADLKAIEDNLDKQAADHEGLQEEEVAR